MSLLKLDIYFVRNIQQQSIHFSPEINFIYGANASGKSALLESIFILGRARSFRSLSIKPVINFDSDHLIISAQLANSDDQLNTMGIRMDGKKVDIRINHQSNFKRSDLAYALPIQLIHPRSYELLDTDPHLRREFLDWGVFHDDHNFLLAWRRFKKALSQRNCLLKNNEISQLNVWDNEIGYYGTIVDSYRKNYITKLTPIFLDIVKQFICFSSIEFVFYQGWDQSRELQQVLLDDREKDLRYGYTQSGPHRADFQLLINQRTAKDFVSRGQLKLLVLSLKLAQIELLRIKNTWGCVLIDDFAAELDSESRLKVLRFLVNSGFQVFVTALSKFDFVDLNYAKNYKVFHVEQGNIQLV